MCSVQYNLIIFRDKFSKFSMSNILQPCFRFYIDYRFLEKYRDYDNYNILSSEIIMPKEWWEKVKKNNTFNYPKSLEYLTNLKIIEQKIKQHKGY